MHVMQLFEKLNQEKQITTLMVTHDPVSASYSKRVIFIKDGQFYNELYCGDNREAFYQKILDVLSHQEGNIMTFRQLIFRNVFRNGRSFASYYFSSTFSIMIFFLVSTIAHHPMLKKKSIHLVMIPSHY